MLTRDRLKFFYALEVNSLEANLIYKEFEKFCNLYGFEVYRQDKHGIFGDIKQQIFDEINNSQFVVADVTTRNSNVMLELGYAYACKSIGQDKILVLHRASDVKLPFDIITQFTHFYNLGTSIEQVEKQCESFKEQLLRWFGDDRKRLGFEVDKNDKYEEIMHYPVHKPDFNLVRKGESEKTPGGQRINEIGNIQISHEETEGNWDSGGKIDNKHSSYMSLLSYNNTKSFEVGDHLYINIRAKFNGQSSAKFTLIADGKYNIEINGEKGKNVIMSDRMSKQLVGDKVNNFKNYEYKIIINPQYKTDKEWTNADQYDISKYGFQIGLGTTVEKGVVEISELLIVREKSNI